MYKGQSRVIEKGQYGVKTVQREITRLNGRELKNTILSSSVTKNPVTQVMAKGTKQLVGSGRFLWPISRSGSIISSRFGSRHRDYHTGIDIATSGRATGVPIAAADSGTVIFAGRDGTYGILIKIDHGNGYVTYYAHCKYSSVSVGQTVKRGQTIAAVGMTGHTTGPHVHFEVRYNGVPQNPLRFLK
jgi:murein DD-endopeptidase MepM/ murein hydrolase activator NlpD